MPSREALAADLLDWAGRCAAAGWLRATSGSFSAVTARDPLRLLITRSGADKTRLTAADLLEVDAQGRAVSTGTPSAETALHVAVVRRLGAGAVGHTHSIWSTILSDRCAADGGVELGGCEMLKALTGVTTHEQRVWLNVFENSQDWDRDAPMAVDRLGHDGPPHGFLIRAHGLYAWGADVATARRHLDVLEFLLETAARRMAYSG
jgi:methylthioribulose-1-phosphate dehydratase